MFSILTVITLTFAFALALPTSTGITKIFTLTDISGGEYFAAATLRCETTTGSPKITEIREAAKNLRAINGDYPCTQDNPGWSKCTRIASYGGADVSFCGKPKSRIDCNEAAAAVEHVVAGCEWFGLAGGKWYFDGAPLNIAVH